MDDKAIAHIWLSVFLNGGVRHMRHLNRMGAHAFVRYLKNRGVPLHLALYICTGRRYFTYKQAVALAQPY